MPAEHLFHVGEGTVRRGFVEVAQEPKGDPEVTDECIRFVDIASEIYRLVDLLRLCVAESQPLRLSPVPGRDLRMRRVLVHLAVVPEAGGQQPARLVPRTPTRCAPARARRASPVSHRVRERHGGSERRDGIVEEHRAEDADHQVDRRPVERMHLRDHPFEPDVRQPACAPRERATANIADDRSTPVAAPAGARRARSHVDRPLPQPTSRMRTAGRIGTSSIQTALRQTPGRLALWSSHGYGPRPWTC